jgi:hypothetical protein
VEFEFIILYLAKRNTTMKLALTQKALLIGIIALMFFSNCEKEVIPVTENEKFSNDSVYTGVASTFLYVHIDSIVIIEINGPEPWGEWPDLKFTFHDYSDGGLFGIVDTSNQTISNLTPAQVPKKFIPEYDAFFKGYWGIVTYVGVKVYEYDSSTPNYWENIGELQLPFDAFIRLNAQGVNRVTFKNMQLVFHLYFSVD